MTEEANQADRDSHKKFAVSLFNLVWKYLGMSERTPEEDDTMVHAAHASRYHWGEIGAPVNLARGDWQLSRVYAVLKQPVPALYYAQKCLTICQENNIGDFDLAYAYEALARTYAVDGQPDECRRYLNLAKEAGEKIAEDEDKTLFISDLETIPGYEK